MSAAAEQANLNITMLTALAASAPLPLPSTANAMPLTIDQQCGSAATSSPGIVEQIMPGIFFTKDFINWNEHNLRESNFKYIIIIDKHIQELYYPANNFKLIAQLPHSFGLDFDDYDIGGQMCANERLTAPVATGDLLNLGADFETIVLNFGQESSLANVLPNCYRAVRFIRKAQKSAGGKLLIIDCNGGEQKCVTIVVAYLMYKHNSSFREAFARLKQFYSKADLDRFYANQLYEYEPILKVQRASSCGQSCSRAQRAVLSKRKHNVHHHVFQHADDDVVDGSNVNVNVNVNGNVNATAFDNGNVNVNFKHVTTAYEDAEMLFNPLKQFKPYEDENVAIFGGGGGVGCVVEQQQRNECWLYRACQQQQQQQQAQQQEQQQHVGLRYGITGAYALSSIHNNNNNNDNNNNNGNKFKQARVFYNVPTSNCDNDNEDVVME